jgi:urea transport system substrate-binding protein
VGYFQSIKSANEVCQGVQGQVRARARHPSPVNVPLQQRLPVWKMMVEKAKSFDIEKVVASAPGIELQAPEGLIRVAGNQYVAKKCVLDVRDLMVSLTQNESTLIE